MQTEIAPIDVAPADVERVIRDFAPFRDFVDVALFDPHCGYYSTGNVRFGYGGHYDTFPLALSPFFGRMLAQYAFRFWRRVGGPRRFEICELGAGNGQLCLDALLTVAQRASQEPAWRRFAASVRYRIVERSPALIARQRQQLGPLARRVRWTHVDLAQGPPRRLPLGEYGVVFANEVLDCLSHHKIVSRHDRTPGVVFVVPTLRGAGPDLTRVPGLRAGDWGVPRQEWPALLANAARRRQVRFREVVLPLAAVPGVEPFLRRHYPEFFNGRRFRPYFACPDMETMVASVAQLYHRCDALWIDYGALRDFHLRTAPRQRVFAGPPRSGADAYAAPGLDDITFLVDFSVLAEAAAQAGMRVRFYGPQRELARRSGVALDAAAVDAIVRQRALGWLLALVGVDPERDWRHTGLTWNKGGRGRARLRDDAKRAVDEFLGRRRSNFRLMIMAT